MVGAGIKVAGFGLAVNPKPKTRKTLVSVMGFLRPQAELLGTKLLSSRGSRSLRVGFPQPKPLIPKPEVLKTPKTLNPKPLTLSQKPYTPKP